jgi:hypothetical protein
MDTNELISHSRARFDHHQSKIVLREKYQAKMTFAYGGGMWRAGPELLTTLALYMGSKSLESIVLLDLYETPIQVIPEVLYEQARTRWQEQMNAWLVEYEELNRKR